MTKGLADLRALGPTESFQFISLVTSLLQSFQTQHVQHRDGLLPDDLWRRHRAVGRWWLTNPGMASAMKLIGSAGPARTGREPARARSAPDLREGLQRIQAAGVNWRTRDLRDV
jgi:hypothetical protein